MWAGLAAASAFWPAFAGAAEIGSYSAVTADRLTNPEPGNWMLYRRTYDGQGFSPLDKINTTNVKNLARSDAPTGCSIHLEGQCVCVFQPPQRQFALTTALLPLPRFAENPLTARLSARAITISLGSSAPLPRLTRYASPLRGRHHRRLRRKQRMLCICPA
jgi:hypothetical protein